MRKIIRVKVMPNYRLMLSFDDGRTGEVDLARLVGKGVFSAWSDYAFFESVRIGDSGELVWSNQVDLCPDALYLEVTRQQADDVFPALKREPIHA